MLSIGFGHAQNPVRKIIYTCEQNEEFFWSEFCSNFKIQGTRFACMTINNKTNEMSFVWNGEKLTTASQIWIWYIDLNSKKGNIYDYFKKLTGDDIELYFVGNGKTYGPYESLYYANKDFAYGDRVSYYLPVSMWGSPNLKARYHNNFFWFKRMGKWYRHDIDEAIYPVGLYNDRWFTESNPIYTSRNGKHIAKFTEEYRLLNFDGTDYILDVDLDIKMDEHQPEIYVTDSGICMGFYLAEKYFIIKDGKLQYFKGGYDDVFFNPETEELENTRKKFESTKTNFIKQQFQVYDKKVSENAGNYMNLPVMSFSDNSNKHYFNADWNYDYIMIDDKKIKSEVPIEAFYDESNNAFGWVTIEGRSLVLDSYTL